MKNLAISSLPELILKAGALLDLPDLMLRRGVHSIGLIYGRTVFAQRGDLFRNLLRERGIQYYEAEVSGEPSPELVDRIRAEWQEDVPRMILAIGGGSVLDTGKAVAAMLAEDGTYSVERFLEGVGDLTPSGATLPLWAVPTTAGTGSEATRNAVISRIGSYKKSLRHENFVPRLACLDPELAVGTPAVVTAASGLDAVTQLIEGYLSTGANEFTDALAISGLKRAGRGFPLLLENGNDLEARGEMAYAAYLSGVVLAHAGLGVVHGAASPLGAAREVPHGVVCGLLLPGSLRRIESQARIGNDRVTLFRIEQITAALGAKNGDCIDLLESWLERALLPGFGSFGFSAAELKRVAGKTALKNSPVLFSEEEIAAMLLEKL